MTWRCSCTETSLSDPPGRNDKLSYLICSLHIPDCNRQRRRLPSPPTKPQGWSETLLIFVTVFQPRSFGRPRQSPPGGTPDGRVPIPVVLRRVSPRPYVCWERASVEIPPRKRQSHASQIVIVIILTARRDGLQRTPRIRFATHRNVLGSVRPVRARRRVARWAIVPIIGNFVSCQTSANEMIELPGRVCDRYNVPRTESRF